MPGGDKTGPMGQGARTGRRLGYCSGNDAPGFERGFGFGAGLGRGGGRGRQMRKGRGFRNGGFGFGSRQGDNAREQ